MPTTCPTCKGSGKKNLFSKCQTCGGVGTLPDPVKVGGSNGGLIILGLIFAIVLVVFCVSGGFSGGSSAGRGGSGSGSSSGGSTNLTTMNCAGLQAAYDKYSKLADQAIRDTANSNSPAAQAESSQGEQAANYAAHAAAEMARRCR